MSRSEEYKPISCAIYDVLELSATRKNPVTLKLANGSEKKVLIKNIETRQNEGEFLLDHEGNTYRLDEIIGVLEI